MRKKRATEKKRSGRGYTYTLAGRPLVGPMLCLRLGECRKVMRYRAAQHGATPTTAEIDEALYRVLVLGEALMEPYTPITEPPTSARAIRADDLCRMSDRELTEFMGDARARIAGGLMSIEEAEELSAAWLNLSELFAEYVSQRRWGCGLYPPGPALVHH